MLLIHYSVSMVVKMEGESCTVLELSSLEHLPVPGRTTLEMVTLSPPLVFGWFFVLRGWGVQCRGPAGAAEGVLQGHEMGALADGHFMVLKKP